MRYDAVSSFVINWNVNNNNIIVVGRRVGSFFHSRIHPGLRPASPFPFRDVGGSPGIQSVKQLTQTSAVRGDGPKQDIDRQKIAVVVRCGGGSSSSSRRCFWTRRHLRLPRMSMASFLFCNDDDDVFSMGSFDRAKGTEMMGWHLRG